MTTHELDIADVVQIQQLMVRYATGIDTRDWALFRSCFTDDFEADYGRIGEWSDPESYTTWMERAHSELGHTLHRITNVAAQSLSTDSALSRCYVDSLTMRAGNQTGTRATGYYDDELVRQRGRWKIRRRRFTLALLRNETAEAVHR